MMTTIQYSTLQYNMIQCDNYFFLLHFMRPDAIVGLKPEKKNGKNEMKKK